MPMTPSLPVNQYYDQGYNTGIAPMQGVQAGQDLAEQQQIIRARQMANDLEQRRQQGAQALAAGDQAAFAGAGVPGGGLPLPWQSAGDPSQSPPGGDPAQGGTGAGMTGSPTAPADYSQNNLANRKRQEAVYYRSIGQGDLADKAEQDARKADIFTINQHGMAAAQDPEALNHIAQWVNSSNLGMTMTPGADGYMRIGLTGEDGKPKTVQLNRMQTARMLGGIAVYSKDPDFGLNIIGEVNGDLAKTVLAHNAQVIQTAQENNKALTDSKNTDAREQVANARTIAAYAAMDKAQAYGLRMEAGQAARGAPVQLVDSQGHAHVFTRGMDGHLSEEQLPPGMQLPRQAADPKAIESVASNLIGQPMPNRLGPDGKPMKYDAINAYQAAAAALSGGGQSGGGFVIPPGMTPEKAAALAGGEAAAKPAGGLKAPSGGGRMDSYYAMHPELRPPPPAPPSGGRMDTYRKMNGN